MANVHYEAVSYRKDGSFALASSSLTGRVWDGSLWVFTSVEDYRQCPVLSNVASQTSSGVSDILWLPNETQLLVASDSGEVQMWNCHLPGNTAEYQCSLGSHDDMVLTLTRTADHERVISGGADSKIIVWDVNNKRLVKSYKGHAEMVYSVTAHPTDRECFMSTSKDGHIRLWDLRKPKPASKFQAQNGDVYTSLLWCPSDENLVAIGSRSGSVEVVDMRFDKGYLFACYNLHQRQVHRMAFAPWDCSLLASVSDDTNVRVTDTKDGTNVYSSSSHVDFVHGVSWHPTDPLLITCAWDGLVLQHSIDTSKKEDDHDQPPPLSSSSTDNPLPVTDGKSENSEVLNSNQTMES